MKNLFVLILTITAVTYSTAQNTVTWLGGTPGNETNWNEAKNWSNQRVPNVFSNVWISDVSTRTRALPVIEAGTVELNTLTVESLAALTVQQNAHLVVYGSVTGKENLRIKGTVLIIDEAASKSERATAAVDVP